MKDIIIVGAGGFGRELLQWVEDINSVKKRWSIKGFIDDNLAALDDYECDYKIIGKIEKWRPNENETFACAIADPQIKEKVVNDLKEKGAKFETIIHPTALIGKHISIGEGFVAYPNSLITTNAKVGDFVTLLMSAIGHDVKVDDYSTISSFCDITGGVSIGKRVFLGSHATIVPGRKVGNDAYIAAGSVVMSNVKEGKRVMGNPAKKLNL